MFTSSLIASSLIIFILIFVITTSSSASAITLAPATFDVAGAFETVDDVAPFCAPASCYVNNTNPLVSNKSSSSSPCSCPSNSTKTSFRLLNRCNGPNTEHGGFLSFCSYNTYNTSTTETTSSSNTFGGYFQMDDDVPFKSSGCRTPNPITGACTCPQGFFSSSSSSSPTTFDVLADSPNRGGAINTKISFCVKKTSNTLLEKNTMFGGVYLASSSSDKCITGNVLADGNSSTSSCSCPSWTDSSLTSRFPVITTNGQDAFIVLCQRRLLPEPSSLPSPPPPALLPSFQLFVSAANGSDIHDGLTPSSAFATLTKALSTIENYRSVDPDSYAPRSFTINLVVRSSSDNFQISNNTRNDLLFFHNSTIQISQLAGGCLRMGSHLTIRTYYNTDDYHNEKQQQTQTRKAILSGGQRLIDPSEWTPSQQHKGIFELQLPSQQATTMIWSMWEFDSTPSSSSSSPSRRVLLHQSETVQYKSYDIKSNVITMNPGVPPLPSSTQVKRKQKHNHERHRKSSASATAIFSKLKSTTTRNEASDDSFNPPLSSAYVYIYHSWTSSLSAIAKFSPQQNEITVAGSISDNHFNAASGSRFRIANILNDEPNMKPGSFVFDKQASVIKYRPFNIDSTTGLPALPVIIPTSVAIVLKTSPLAENIHLENLEFAHTASNLDAICIQVGCSGQSASVLPDAALDLYSSHTSVTNCNIRHTAAQYAVWVRDGTSFVTLQKTLSSSSSVPSSLPLSSNTNDNNNSFLIEDLGAGGVRVGSPSSHAFSSSILDVTIRNGGFVIEQGCGILAQKVAFLLASHNLIHDMKYSAISVGWTWNYVPTQNTNNVISYNRMYNIMKGVLSDGGCVYFLGFDWGSTVDHNLCHDVQSYGYGGWGYYLDQATSGTIWSNNIVYRTKAAGFHIHFGLYNLLINNIIAFPQQLVIGKDANQGDFAGLRSSPSSSGFESITQFNFIRNIIFQRNTTSTLFYKTTTVAFQNTSFADIVYFNTEKSIDELEFPTPSSSSCTSWSCWQAAGKDRTGSTRANPQFEGDVSSDYDFSKLMSSSPALAVGFQPIDQSAIGPRV